MRWKLCGSCPRRCVPLWSERGRGGLSGRELRKFDTVYPAAGNGHTAVKLTLQELEAAAGAEGWADICKEPEGE